MPRTIAQLSPLEIAFLQGFVQDDPARFNAVVLGFFEEQTARHVERETGLPRSTVSDLINRFRLVYGPWRHRHGEPGADSERLRHYLAEAVGSYMEQRDLMNDGEHARVLTHAAGTG